MLRNFSIAKETVIARAHFIVIILNLRPNNRFKLGFYKRIRGHAVILSQNLE